MIGKGRVLPSEAVKYNTHTEENGIELMQLCLSMTVSELRSTATTRIRWLISLRKHLFENF